MLLIAATLKGKTLFKSFERDTKWFERDNFVQLDTCFQFMIVLIEFLVVKYRGNW